MGRPSGARLNSPPLVSALQKPELFPSGWTTSTPGESVKWKKLSPGASVDPDIV